ncbi:MAG: hypothetical protein EBX56_09860 [Betaproteobacteria bacterium]|nr:hypothetical protein [Betaproteobacteria bacterium]
MRKLLILAFFLPLMAWAQSSLPPCQGDDKIRWTNCLGTWTWPYGGKYVGEWKDGKEHGRGMWTWPSGIGYAGDFKDGKEHGHGTWTRSNGDRYVGQWQDGKEHGQGTMTRSNGDRYVGQWQDGKEQGEGVLYRKDESVLRSGLWFNGAVARETLN